MCYTFLIQSKFYQIITEILPYLKIVYFKLIRLGGKIAFYDERL